MSRPKFSFHPSGHHKAMTTSSLSPLSESDFDTVHPDSSSPDIPLDDNYAVFSDELSQAWIQSQHGTTAIYESSTSAPPRLLVGNYNLHDAFETEDMPITDLTPPIETL